MALFEINPQRFTKLKQHLDALHQRMNIPELVKGDPVQFVHRFTSKEDKEIAGILSAMLAIGNIKVIIKKLKELFEIMHWQPYFFVMNFEKEKNNLEGFRHRWIMGEDIELLLSVLKYIYTENDGLKEFFLQGYSSGLEDLSPAIYKFVDNVYEIIRYKIGNKDVRRGFKSFLSPGSSTSPYKRLNLFLRWMVRDEDGLDAGLWREIKTSQLIIPLDTHIARISMNIGLTKRNITSMKMAKEITWNLKKIEPQDPLKYDFPLCHLGISIECNGRYNRKVCDACEINGVCREYRESEKF